MNIIRKNLKEIKEKKESQLIEKNLIESRLRFILGDKTPKSLSEEKKVKVGFELFEEISTLSNQGLINETNLLGTFKALFGNDIHSLPETFYKPWIDTVLKTLNMNDSYLKDYLITQITKTPKVNSEDSTPLKVYRRTGAVTKKAKWHLFNLLKQKIELNM
jgi:hypothetical protein